MLQKKIHSRRHHTYIRLKFKNAPSNTDFISLRSWRDPDACARSTFLRRSHDGKMAIFERRKMALTPQNQREDIFVPPHYSRDRTASSNSPLPGPKGLTSPGGCPERRWKEVKLNHAYDRQFTCESCVRTRIII